MGNTESSTIVKSWKQIGQDINGEAANDNSGFSVSLSSDGKTVAIGAHLNDGNGYKSGHVRVYKYVKDNKEWTKIGQDIDGEYLEDRSGESVSLSSDGKTVAIGAPRNTISGHVRVYQYDLDGKKIWTQKGKDIDGESMGLPFSISNSKRSASGKSVSLSSDGNTVAIGDPRNWDKDFNSGHVRVYQYDLNNKKEWTQKGQDIDGEASGDYSGNSVSLSSDGNTVAIGAKYNDNGNGEDSGHVRVYRYDSDNKKWTQIGKDIDGETAEDYSGYSVSLSSDGNRVAIGAKYNDNGNGEDSGHVRVYEFDSVINKRWIKIGQDINGEAAYDESGTSVSLSSDGNRVAIGAWMNNGNGNGNNSGHVRVYQYDSNNKKKWTQIGKDIDGETSEDYSGHSVSLSSDGKTVAIGASKNNGNGDNGDNYGHVRVYQLETNQK